MSLNAVLSNALSGLAVAQNALAVTSNNVANANTAGYSRQVAQQESVVLAGRGAGARSLPTTRAVDDLLTARARDQASRVGRSDALDTIHQQIQDRILGAPGDASQGLSARLTDLATAAEALAAGPEEAGLGAGLLGAGEGLARAISGAGSEVQAMRREVDGQIADTVTSANATLARLADINEALTHNGATPDLLDSRDRLLDDLAQQLDVSVNFGPRGVTTVYARGGAALLDGELRQLVYEPATEVGQTTSFGAIRIFDAEDIDAATGQPLAGTVGDLLVSAGVRAELPSELQGDAIPDAAQQIVSPLRTGRLQGLLEARDRLLPDLADELGELADLTRFTLNAAHNSANPNPPATSLTGTRTDTDAFAGAVRSGTAYLAVIDRTSGAVATTIAIDVAGSADASALAASLSAGLGGYGSAAIDGAGRLVISAAGNYALAVSEADSAITATDAQGHARAQGFSHFFGLNDLLVVGAGGPTELRVRTDLAADSRLVSRSVLDVDVGPPMTAQLGGKGDNRGAQALAAAFETATAAVPRGALPGGSFKLADYAAELVAVRAGAAERASADSALDQDLLEDLDLRRSEVSGVNLDEELSRLVLFQQAYSVSARLLAITNQLFDDLLAVTG
ncbi:MAG: flagellar basal body rod C-terminal domain-containing protein [Geminicoccaceae bacterium]